ncbi:L,D-transpeptidase [Silvimonas iriomotensis]|uniref:L,D-TPase catalytic domain-containing protein n=1 Tax=Silvimonas iriomotensis TaxID=449662 RepID=A0ABQ2P6U0_9NEIS|nr:L,D-transpeptidase [Silvimonas iriomotensis]GGP19421.1 hypothetical protein GCM10010970_10530 [Silvimonas iriomotensis]
MTSMHIEIDLAAQTLHLFEEGRLIRQYTVSTAAAGIGEQQGSMKTPRGRHTVRALIGRDLPQGSVLRGRRPTGEIHTPELGAQHRERDWILSRIIWLSGCQPGFNRLGPVDTMRRYIYIHGTPDDQPMGVPGSHGCIRMRNEDVIDLFARIRPGIDVLLLEAPAARQRYYVAAVPVNSLAALQAQLVAAQDGLPASPVASDDHPAWALWRGDGQLQALLRLQAGSGLQIWQHGAGEPTAWFALWPEAERAALARGWREVRLLLPANQPAPAGFEMIRTLPDAVLWRHWLAA